MRTSNRVLVVAMLAVSIQSIGRAASAPPTAADRGDLVTDYHGIRVADPYRALEDLKAPRTQEWASAQAAFTREQLDRLPGRKALFERIKALDAERSPFVSSLSVTPKGQWFYLKRLGTDSTAKLYVRATADGPERVLLDPALLQKRDGVVRSINDFSVAPDGAHVAAIVSVADAELGELQVLDADKGEPVLPPVPGIWGELPAIWSRDGRSMLYAQGAAALSPASEPFGKMQVYERFLDKRPDRKLMGWKEAFGPEIRAKDWVYVDPASSTTYTLAALHEGIGSDGRLLVSSSSELRSDPVRTTWRTVFDADAHVRGFAAIDSFVYARTFQGAARYRVLRYDLTRLGSAPVEVVAEQNGVIDTIAVAKDGLYYVLRVGSVARIFRLRHGEPVGSAERVELPFDGTVRLLDANPLVPGIVFSLEGWTHELQVMRAEGTRVARTDIVAPSATQIGADWVSEEVSCTSHDGAVVPMSIVYRRGLVKDGSNPTLVDGYGGYGWPERAYFNRKLQAWFEQGGVFAEVKPRGGGALGRDWYQAGAGPRKANTWKDMIACSEALISRGYTSRAKLAIQGTSMGGVAVGRAVTERPDLFAVAIVRVGITDAVRFIEASPNGPNHEAEMGSVKTEDGVRQLLAMSTYHHIVTGQAYPAMLFTTGMNDNRVAPWNTLKTFASVAAATSSHRPTLLRIESEGGHGLSATADQLNSELADRLAFILWNTGSKGFQPVR